MNRLLLVSSLICLTSQAALAQDACAKLKDLQIPKVEISSVTAVAAASVPAHCVIKAVARPTTDSQINVQVWLPISTWNGKYLQVGNGGWAGNVPEQMLGVGVQRGYVTAGTDDGHTEKPDARWAIGHPEKLIDFGYRALHQTREIAQAAIEVFYGKDSSRAYFAGCSDGGREALMMAQRFPEDFDGIVAGAPANDWSHLMASAVWNEQALLKDDASAIPPAKLPALHKAVLDACDANDGVKDGLVEDPRACHFDPAVLLCKSGDAPTCLTHAQVESVRKLYAGPKNPRTGQQIFPGFPPGTELWGGWLTPEKPASAIQFMFGNSYFGQAVYETANWNFRSFNFDSDVAYADSKAGAVTTASNPDLRTFRAHGGKLIQYHGWGDPAITPYSSINYYESVKTFLSTYPDPRSKDPGPVENFYRLFLVPGMDHCNGGLGVSIPFTSSSDTDAEHDVLTALTKWVEDGVAPEKLIGTGKAPLDSSKTMTRPICRYPQTAHYKGSGDIYDAQSFECR